MEKLKETKINQAIEKDMNLPSFSIVFETENLATVELDNLYRSLSSLVNQDIPLEQAKEFLAIDSGNAPPEVIEELCSMYPWITLQKASGIGYHESKMLGANLTTGEIVVMCDSDCIYQPNWLRNMLTPFSENTEINILAGETKLPVRNPYELAIAIEYFFPPCSGQQEVYESPVYFLNNVAFRRNFLLEHPFPKLNNYRGTCYVHGCYLRERHGHKIWKQPLAQATHEPPEISLTFFWRYLVMGRDQLINNYIKRLLIDGQNPNNYFQMLAEFSYLQKIRLIISNVLLRFNLLKRRRGRMSQIFKEEPRRLLFFPFALPIILWFNLLYVIGNAITYFNPDLLLKLYYRSQQVEIDKKDGALSTTEL